MSIVVEVAVRVKNHCDELLFCRLKCVVDGDADDNVLAGYAIADPWDWQQQNAFPPPQPKPAPKNVSGFYFFLNNNTELIYIFTGKPS